MRIRSARAVITWVGVGLLLWLAAVVMTLLDVRRELASAEDRVAVLQDSGLDSLEADELRLIDRSLQKADREMDRFYLEPVKWLPILGRQVRVVDAVAETLASISGPAIRGLDLASSDLPDRLAMLEQLEHEVSTMREGVQQRNLGPGNSLFGGLGEQRADLERQLADLEPQIVKVEAAVTAVRSLLEGGDYLLLGANNSEMMVGSGMVLSVGLLEVDRGEVILGEFGSVRCPFPGTDDSTVKFDRGRCRRGRSLGLPVSDKRFPQADAYFPVRRLRRASGAADVGGANRIERRRSHAARPLRPRCAARRRRTRDG